MRILLIRIFYISYTKRIGQPLDCPILYVIAFGNVPGC